MINVAVKFISKVSSFKLVLLVGVFTSLIMPHSLASAQTDGVYATKVFVIPSIYPNKVIRNKMKHVSDSLGKDLGWCIGLQQAEKFY